LPLLLFGRRAWRDVGARGLLPPLVIVLVGVLAGQSAVPHYLAPVAGIILLWIVQAIRHLRAWRPKGRDTGAFLAQAVLVLLTLLVAIRPFDFLPAGDGAMSWCCVTPGNLRRAQLVRALNREVGGQLVMVRYQPNHYFHVEWVYNDADIDAAKIVWSREINPEEDRRLFDYFHDRTVWLLKADEYLPVLERYPR
jgi:hypothetical protein